MPSIRSKALKDYSSGDLITRSEPLVKVINNHYKGMICDNCCSTTSLKTCSKCKQMNYCCIDCQRNDWFCHKYECNLFSKYENIDHLFQKLDEDSKPVERLVLRLLLLLKNNESIASKVYQINNGLDLCLNDIDSHSEDFKKSSRLLISFDYLCKKFTEFEIEFNEESLFRLFCITIRYSFTSVMHFSYFTEKFLLEMSPPLPARCWGLYIPLTVYRHSCSPNSALVLNGTEIQLRAIKGIKTGDEISASLYGYLYLNREKRRKVYNLHNYFKCDCIRCETHSDKDFDFNLMKRLFAREVVLLLQHNPTQIIAIKEQIIAKMKAIVSECDPLLIAMQLKLLKFRISSLKSSATDVTIDTIPSLCDNFTDLLRPLFGSDHKDLVVQAFMKGIRDGIES